MKYNSKMAEKNIQIAVTINNYPPCFDDKFQYNAWLEIEQVVHTLPFRKNICEDCTRGFKTEMVFQKRCCNIETIVSD